jgi:hypothetical protein
LKNGKIKIDTFGNETKIAGTTYVSHLPRLL